MKINSRGSSLSLTLRLCAMAVPIFLPTWLMGPLPVRGRSLLEQIHEFREKDSVQACGKNLRPLLDSICFAHNMQGYYNPTPRIIPGMRGSSARVGRNIEFRYPHHRQHHSLPGEVLVRTVREAPITDECCRKPCDRSELLKYCASSHVPISGNAIRADYVPTATTTTAAPIPASLELQDQDDVSLLPCLVHALWGWPSHSRKSLNRLSCQRYFLGSINPDEESVKANDISDNVAGNVSHNRAATPAVSDTGSPSGRRTIGRSIIERDIHPRIKTVHHPYLHSRTRPRHLPVMSSDEIGNDDEEESSASAYNNNDDGDGEGRTEEWNSMERRILGSSMESLAEAVVDDVRSREIFPIPSETSSQGVRRLGWK